MSPDKAYPWRYGLPLALYYGCNGIVNGYIAKYYQSHGVPSSSIQMMFLMAALPIMALIAQPLWGRIGDSMRYRNQALSILVVGAMLMIALLPISSSFAWLMAISCLFAVFYTPVQPMADSIILEALERDRASFGPARLMGSLGFALVNLTLGGVFEGRERLIPYAMLAGLLLLLLSVQVLPKTRGHQRGRARVPISRILKVPQMLPLFGLLTVLMLSIGFFYSYYSLHFTALPGGSLGLLGLSFFISSMSELPFLLFSQRLFRRYGAGRLMVVSALLLFIRFLLMGLARHAYLLLFTQLLHGGTFIVITVCMAQYISLTVPDEIKAGGQMLLAVVGFGLARVFGTFCGGLISRAAGGIEGGFLAMAALCFLALAFFGPYFFRRPPLTGLKPASLQ